MMRLLALLAIALFLIFAILAAIRDAQYRDQCSLACLPFAGIWDGERCVCDLERLSP